MTPADITIHVIIDPRRESSVVQHLADQGCNNVVVHEPIYAETVVSSINLTHKSIVALAQFRGESHVIVAEQDLFFPSPNGLDLWLRGMTPHAPLYLAGAYNIPDIERIREIHARSGFPIILTSFTRGLEGFHCYMLHQSSFDAFLQLPDDDHIDVLAINTLGCAVPYPQLAIQLAGYSATQRKWQDKNVSLDQRDVYGPIPIASHT